MASTDDLCRIIKICAKSNVTKISIGELRLEFEPGDQTVPQLSRKIDTKSIEQATQQISEEAGEEQRKASMQQWLEELRITDPYEFEKLIGGGELEDVGKAP